MASGLKKAGCAWIQLTLSTPHEHRNHFRIHDRSARGEASGAHSYGRYLDEFEVGAAYKHWPAKTVTEADDHLFCLITMNHHPLHINDVYAGSPAGAQRRRRAAGLQPRAGMSVSDVSGKAIANLATEELSHPAPVFHGDTLFVESEVLEEASRAQAGPRNRQGPHGSSTRTVRDGRVHASYSCRAGPGRARGRGGRSSRRHGAATTTRSRPARLVLVERGSARERSCAACRAARRHGQIEIVTGMPGTARRARASGGRPRLRRRSRSGQQGDELLAAPAKARRDPQADAELVRHPVQHAVARVVTEVVVERLKWSTSTMSTVSSLVALAAAISWSSSCRVAAVDQPGQGIRARLRSSRALAARSSSACCLDRTAGPHAGDDPADRTACRRSRAPALENWVGPSP